MKVTTLISDSETSCAYPLENWNISRLGNGVTMSNLSFRLARAVSSGRKNGGKPADREAVLARLLVKRAAAHRAGLDDLESIMRHQIEWSLPMKQGTDEEGPS